MIPRFRRYLPPKPLHYSVAVPESPEIRIMTALVYLGVWVLLAGFPYLAYRPRSLELAGGKITIVYPPIAVEGFPLKISVHVRHGETTGPCEEIWPQLEPINGYIRWIPEETSPSERGRSEEGTARTAYPVFEYTGVVEGVHASWAEALVLLTNDDVQPRLRECSNGDFACKECTGGNFLCHRVQGIECAHIRIYVLDLPLPPAFVQALIEGWKYLGVAWLLVLSCMPVLLLLPNELREKILGAIMK